LAGFSLGVNGTTSRYDSLQASLTRRLTHNVQAQVSYTYSKCLGTGDATLGSLSQNSPTLYSNPFDRSPDKSICGYSVTQALRVNSLVTLPFHGNRLVEGWQISGLIGQNTGLPFSPYTGTDIIGWAGSNNNRPNYVAGCKVQVETPNKWFDPNCYTLPAAGTLGATAGIAQGIGHFRAFVDHHEEDALAGAIRLFGHGFLPLFPKHAA